MQVGGTTRRVTFDSKAVYSGFKEKCTMRIDAMRGLRTTLASSVNGDVRYRSTLLAQHKLYVRQLPDFCSMLTLYVVREV